MKKILALGSIVILLLTTAACGGNVPASNNEPQETVKVKQSVDAFGVVAVSDVKNITIDFNTSVEKVQVQEGQNIKMGDPLITLAIGDYQEQIKTKERDIARLVKGCDAKKELLKDNSDPDIKKLLNDFDVASEDYADASDMLKREEELYKGNAITKDELDEFKKSVDSKKNVVHSAELSIASLKYDKQKEIDDIQDKIITLENELQLMKNKLNRSFIKQNEIVSDVQNGIVCNIGYVNGDEITPGSKILSIMNLNSIVVNANVAEEFIKDVKIGADVAIIPQADKTKTYKGKVVSISSKAVQKSGVTEVPTIISIDNKDGFLLPDFNVDVKININQK